MDLFIFNTKDLPLAFTPEFCMRLRVNPGTFKGTTSKPIPDLPWPPVRTAVVQ